MRGTNGRAVAVASASAHGLLIAIVVLVVPLAAEAKTRLLVGGALGVQRAALIVAGRLNLALGDRFELGGEVGQSGSIFQDKNIPVTTVLGAMRFNAIHIPAGDLYLHGLVGYVGFSGERDASGAGYGAGFGWSSHFAAGYLRWCTQIDIIGTSADLGRNEATTLYRLLLGIELSVPGAGAS